jgi:hypothetical protein
VACVVLFVLGASLGGCDSGTTPTPISEFPDEDPYARQIEGRVLYGTEAVPALVHIDASPGFANDARLAAAADPSWTTSTDSGLKYHILSAPFRYDLSVRTDSEVALFQAIGVRFFEAPLGPQPEVSGFHARVAVTTDPPPRPGNALAFFVSGPDARATSGDASSLLVSFGSYDTTITLHVVEYPVSAGLAGAVNEGRAEISVHAGGASAVRVHLVPVATSNTVTFVAALLPGFALSAFDVAMDLGVRTSANVVGHGAVGVPFTIATVPGARYSVHARATREGASSDTGRQYFDPAVKAVVLSLEAPLSAEAPIDDTAAPPTGDVTLDVGGVLAARVQSGVVEHVLVRSGGGRTIRVLTEARATTLPAFTALAVGTLAGRYAWSIRHYPSLTRIDDLRGPDVRVVPPTSVTAERTVLVR